ncbi:MAG TPA: YtxH domain-containing protein [Salinimicrobium sp.]|nr:YtxH domain-containing protein [Salinimicrobium sp.]
MRTGKVILGIISGAAAGAVAGLLLAPKKGVDTRQRIKDKSNECVNDTKNKFNELVGKASSNYDRFKSKASRKSRKMEADMKADLENDEKIIY